MKPKSSALFVAALVLAAATGCRGKVADLYLGSADSHTVAYYDIGGDDELAPAGQAPRGTAVRVRTRGAKRIDGHKYLSAKVGKGWHYVDETNLAASPEEAVAERVVYVRTPASVIADRATSRIGTLAAKGAELTVLDYDSLCPDGSVWAYRTIKNFCHND